MASSLLPAPSFKTTAKRPKLKRELERVEESCPSSHFGCQYALAKSEPAPLEDGPRVKRLKHAAYEVVEPAFASLSISPASPKAVVTSQPPPLAATTTRTSLSIPIPASASSNGYLASPTTSNPTAQLPVTPPNPAVPSSARWTDTPDSFLESEQDDVPMGKAPSSFDIDKHTIYVASLDDDDDDSTSDEEQQEKIPSFLLHDNDNDLPPSPLKLLLTQQDKKASQGQLILYKPLSLFARPEDQDERQADLDEYQRMAQREEALNEGLMYDDDEQSETVDEMQID